MTNLIRKSKPRHGHFHNGKNQRGWTNSVSRVGTWDNQLDDFDFQEVCTTHNHLWRNHIAKVYAPKVDNIKTLKEYPIVVLGYNMLPIAVELSQWDFPVTFVTSDKHSLAKSLQDIETHAGNMKNVYAFDYTENSPRGKFIVFSDILIHLPDERKLWFIDMLLERCRIIICAEKIDYDWRSLLGKRYNIIMSRYPEGDYDLIKIKKERCLGV